MQIESIWGDGRKANLIFRIGKEDLYRFIAKLIDEDSRRVIGVKKKEKWFVFDELESAEELRLDHDVTLHSPKKLFLPPYENMMSYSMGKGISIENIVSGEPMIVVGVHPYDIIALKQMDTVFLSGYKDDLYHERRKNSIIIGVNMANVSQRSFADSMGCALTEDGYDLMLTDLGEYYTIEVGSEKGEGLLEPYSIDAKPADEEAIKALEHFKRELPSRFKNKLNFPKEELPGLLKDNYTHPIWKSESQKCLACGSCVMVCPTCYCFDIYDSVDIEISRGERTRTWDGCLLKGFAEVAGGVDFRGDRIERYRHRFFRKGSYLPERYDFVACVGCGRCASSCLPDIADPVKIYNEIHETTKEARDD